ncbi:hypothetical protein K492DRAFT_178201 [Lichtheimia hyalospora FSU 10163]|nr:hypothetical protein K492DRAFT_178201 [Lichtheimia hyalospora FSU 10163]
MNDSSNVQQQHELYAVSDYDIIQQEEEAYFGDYDRAVAAAALSADYYDGNYDYQDEFVEQEDEDMMELDQEDDPHRQDDENNNMEHLYNYQEDSLLHLIVGVQSYLSDMANTGIDRNDSPLLELQYKMYTYLKQRACDMGVDAENLC